MAETAPAEPQTPAAQPAPVVASIDALDAAMANARQAATAQQAALETETNTQPGAQERAPASTETDTRPASDQPAADAAQEADDEEQDASPDQGTQPPGKLSRTGRLREQLTQADQRARDAETRLQERLSSEVAVRQKWANLLGTPHEKAQLEGILANPASPSSEVNQARTRLAQMRQANSELAPLYAAVQEDVFAGFTRGLQELRTLDGMDDAAHQSLFKAPSGVDALKIMHGIGKKAAQDEAKGEIANLTAQVKDLKTKLAAAGTQPAGAGGRSPGAATALAGLYEPGTIFPTEEAIRRAKNREFVNLGSASA